VTSCKRDTEASSDYTVFKGASIHPTHSYIQHIHTSNTSVNSNNSAII